MIYNYRFFYIMITDKEVLKALETLEEGNPYATFLNNSTLSTVDSWIDTGSYVLNAIISGRIRGGGVPGNRVSMFFGESQCIISEQKIKVYKMQTK